MKKIAKIPVTFESRLSSEEFAQKVKDVVAEQDENVTYAEKGRQIFYWESLGDDKYSLKFYHSYKSDMCDTAFYGQVNKGLSGCQLDGHIKKPGGVFLLTLRPVALVEVNLLMFDKKRLKAINEYLREFTTAENIDVLGEELEEDERG